MNSGRFTTLYRSHEIHHLLNAERHEALGHPVEWAEQSRQKAAKWRKKHDDDVKRDADFHRDHPEFAEMIDILVNGIADGIMRGNPESGHSGLFGATQ